MDLMQDGTTVEKLLFEKAGKEGIPLYGVLELLPLCNMKCEMCYVRMDYENMIQKGKLCTIQEWIQLAKEMKKEGTLFILLTGGEPLLYKGFKELYLELQKMGMIVTINTNGTLIDEEWASFFGSHRPRRINITLYGGGEETYDTLCHYKKGFEQTLRGIKLLQKNNVDVKLNGSLAKGNMDDWEKILDIGEELGIPVRMDTYMYPMLRERKCPYNKQVRMSPDEAADLRVKILQREMGEEIFRQSIDYNLYKVLNIEEGEEVPGKMKCKAGKSSFVIAWNGQMRPCVVLEHPSISVLETGFKIAWEKIVKETECIYTSPKCSACKYRAVCNTCAASALAETGNEHEVPEYLCEYTMKTIQNMYEYKRNCIQNMNAEILRGKDGRKEQPK